MVRDKIAEKQLLDEIAFRNMLARLVDSNRGTYGVAEMPRVGVFWIHEGIMHSESTALMDAVDYGDFKIHDRSHYEAWEGVVCANPSWVDLEYDQVPRGRVLFRPDLKRPEFIVYLPVGLKDHESQIRAEFKLNGKVSFDYSDEHYRIQ
jgi:hypothetical protein